MSVLSSIIYLGRIEFTSREERRCIFLYREPHLIKKRRKKAHVLLPTMPFFKSVRILYLPLELCSHLWREGTCGFIDQVCC